MSTLVLTMRSAHSSSFQKTEEPLILYKSLMVKNGSKTGQTMALLVLKVGRLWS